MISVSFSSMACLPSRDFPTEIVKTHRMYEHHRMLHVEFNTKWSRLSLVLVSARQPCKSILRNILGHVTEFNEYFALYLHQVFWQGLLSLTQGLRNIFEVVFPAYKWERPERLRLACLYFLLSAQTASEHCSPTRKVAKRYLLYMSSKKCRI